MEIWKIIKGFENYSISNLGRVKRNTSNTLAKKGHILKQGKNGKYKHVTPIKDGIQYTKVVHVLVAFAFIGPKPRGKVINHKDGNRFNNNADNLEYITNLENMRHAYRLNLIPIQRGSKHWRSVLTEKDVIKIRKLHYEGISQRKLAIMFKVHFGNINMIVLRRTWRHI